MYILLDGDDDDVIILVGLRYGMSTAEMEFQNGIAIVAVPTWDWTWNRTWNRDWIGSDRISGMQLIWLDHPLDDTLDLAPPPWNWIIPRGIYQFLFLFSLSFLFLFLSFKLHTLPHTHTRTLCVRLYLATSSTTTTTTTTTPPTSQPTTKKSISLANSSFSSQHHLRLRRRLRRPTIATSTSTAAPTLPLQSPSTATTPSSSSSFDLRPPTRPDPIDRLLEQTAKPVIQDDADGHLIYHTGDILHHRCS